MTPTVVHRWHEFIGGGHDPAVLDALLADDAVFHSPALFRPQEGRAKTAMYLTAAAKVFGPTDFHYVGEWYAPDSAVLEFTADLDGTTVDGIDMITWNSDEKIVAFKVMIRPFRGLQTVMSRMAELLPPA